MSNFLNALGQVWKNLPEDTRTTIQSNLSPELITFGNVVKALTTRELAKDENVVHNNQSKPQDTSTKSSVKQNVDDEDVIEVEWEEID